MKSLQLSICAWRILRAAKILEEATKKLDTVRILAREDTEGPDDPFGMKNTIIEEEVIHAEYEWNGALQLWKSRLNGILSRINHDEANPLMRLKEIREMEVTRDQVRNILEEEETIDPGATIWL